MFIHVAADHAARAVGATTLMEEYMDASNFGVQRREGGVVGRQGVLNPIARMNWGDCIYNYPILDSISKRSSRTKGLALC